MATSHTIVIQAGYKCCTFFPITLWIYWSLFGCCFCRRHPVALPLVVHWFSRVANPSIGNAWREVFHRHRCWNWNWWYNTNTLGVDFYSQYKEFILLDFLKAVASWFYNKENQYHMKYKSWKFALNTSLSHIFPFFILSFIQHIITPLLYKLMKNTRFWPFFN